MDRFTDLHRVHGLHDLHGRIDHLSQRLEGFMVSQAEFDAALAQYVADVDSTVQALVAKAAGAAPATDFAPELAAISQAKADFDAATGNTPPAPVAAEPPPADVPPVDVPVDAPPAEVPAPGPDAVPSADPAPVDAPQDAPPGI